MKSGTFLSISQWGLLSLSGTYNNKKIELSIQLAAILYSIAETAVKTELAMKVDTRHSDLESITYICFQRIPHGKIASYLWAE